MHSSAEKREHDALDAQCIAHHMVCSSCVGNCVSMKSVIILRKSVGTVAAGGSSDAKSSTDALEEARGWGEGVRGGATHLTAL